jgi:preprotein translocase subunit SecF
MTNTKIIRFMRLHNITTVISAALLVISLLSIAFKGMSFGLDFTGGILIELQYDKPVKIIDIRNQLTELQYKDFLVQEFGSAETINIRVSKADASTGKILTEQLANNYSGVIKVNKIEFVGPQVGEKLKEQGVLGLLIALALVMLYISLRFQFKFSVGAVSALLHDVILVVGVFSAFDLQFDLTVLAAILAVIGYSLNDSIIVYDRIRENFTKLRKSDIKEIIDISLTQTLGRTLATSGTTLMVLVALFLFGGEAVHNFSLALIIGISVGTYSSIYIASNLLVYMKVDKQDLVKK